MPKHLSVSSLNFFLTFPEAWYYRYIVGVKDFQTTPSMLTGIAVHEGVAAVLNGRKYEPVIKEAIRKEGESLEQEDQELAEQEATRLMEGYVEDGPYFEPLHIELAGEYEIRHPKTGEPLPLPFNYRMDLITTDNLLVDHKTTRYKMTKSQDWQYKNQGVAYWMLYEEMMGKEPDYFVENQIVKTKTPQYHQRFFRYDEQNKIEFWELAREAIDKIEKEQWYGRPMRKTFYPNPLAHLCAK